tara:strand:- start:552 stop:1007 length:456 start_codon:yes stop_codon:yes gene_type:complete
MSSNKSISTKKTITPRMFSDILKKNTTINTINKELKNNRIRCKLLWYTLIKLNEQIDNFEELYSSLDNKSQEKLIDKLLKETYTIYTKYIECGEIDDSLDYELQEFISELKDKYIIVQPQIPIMYISRSASGTKKIKKKILKRKSLAKQKK